MACNGYTRRVTTAAHGCPPTSNTYAHCGDGLGAPCRDMYTTACQEKQDMQGLNDKLAHHLEKLRGLQQQPSIDPATYRNAMCNLEAEMTRLRQGYEAEIDRLRKALEDCCREKNMFAINANQCGTSLSDLQAKVKDLTCQLQQALADKQALCGQLANKDKELADLRACLQRCQDELSAIKPDYNRLKHDADDCRNRLQCELKAKADEDCRLRGMLEKCSFDGSNKDQQIRDLQERLKAANDIIASLEAKIRQLSNHDGDKMNSLLQKMRDDTMADMRRQQQATEGALNQSLQSLKCQIDTDARDKDAISRERARLQELVQQLQSKLGDLDGRLSACCSENAQLKADLERERACSQQEIRNLEQKLREQHGMMMDKVKECTKARDQQVALTTEIGNYRMLVDAADAKMSQQPAPPACPPPSYSTVRRPVSVPPSFSRPTSAFCQPMTPAHVLGASLNSSHNHGNACCGSCASGGQCSGSGPCDTKRPQTARYTCDQFNQRPHGAWSSNRISADFKPVNDGHTHLQHPAMVTMTTGVITPVVTS